MAALQRGSRHALLNEIPRKHPFRGLLFARQRAYKIYQRTVRKTYRLKQCREESGGSGLRFQRRQGQHMQRVADGVWLLSGRPAYAVNVYLAGDTLIDAGTRWARRRIMRQLEGQQLSLLALTHCHPDHQGAAHAVCTHFNVPMACHQADADAAEGRSPMLPRNWIIGLGERVWAGPPHQVGRMLRDGDQVAGFRVVHAPGHTPGHVIYFRESDRLAIAGDVLTNINFLSGRVGLQQPPAFFCVDPVQNLRSIQILWELRPAIICLGHGPPLYGPEALERYMTRLQAALARPTLSLIPPANGTCPAAE